MQKNFKQKLAILSVVILTSLTSFAANFVTLHSPAAGTLKVTPEALTATHLKITGFINADDFQRLKPATMGVTQVLDLSEVQIEALIGGGCYSPITSDMFVGGGTQHQYKANTIPIHAFTKVGDNSVRKWHYGSSSLRKIILPATIEGFETDAFLNVGYLTELEVPSSSRTAYSENNVIYSYDRTRMIGIAPKYADILILPQSVKTISDNILTGITLRGIEIKSIEKVDFGVQSNITAGYIQASAPELYSELFGNSIQIKGNKYENAFNNVEAGTIATLLSNTNNSNGINHLAISGKIDRNDLQIILSLPNLISLDLENSFYASDNFEEEFIVENSKLCTLKLPQGDCYSVYFNNCLYLGGQMTFPQGVSFIKIANTPYISEITAPNSLYDITYDGGVCLHKLDVSKCELMTEVTNVSNCNNLQTLLLPSSITRLKIKAPLENIELPTTLEYLSATGWNIQTLQLPETLTEIASLDRMMNLTTLDVSNASRLVTLQGLNYCPRLADVDLSNIPLTSFEGLNFDYTENNFANANAKGPTRVIVTGRTYDNIIPSGLKTLSLPSTLTSLSGLENCSLLKELNLFNCTSLENISIFGLTSLQTLKLPSELKTVNIMNSCTALSYIHCAANISVPALSLADDLSASNITAYVPNGCLDTYLTADNWNNLKEIIADGYTVRVKSDTLNIPANGSGLYPKGSTVQLSAPQQAYSHPVPLVFNYWEHDNNRYEELYAQFIPTGHTEITSYYKSDIIKPEECDVYISLFSEKETTINMYLFQNPSYGEQYIYLNNELQVTKTHGLIDTQLKVNAGRNEIAVFWKDLPYLSFFGKEGTKLEELYIKNPEAITYLRLGSVGLDKIDITQYPNLEELNVYGNNISEIDLSRCEKLRNFNAGYNQLTNIDFSNNPQLENVDVIFNKLTSLDLSHAEQLQELECSWNVIRDIKVNCANLQRFYNSNNSFGFSQLDEDMYRIIYETGLRNGDQVYQINYNQYQDYYVGDIIDLSHEMTNLNGNPVTITFNDYNISTDGKYPVKEVSPVSFTLNCEAMPKIYFYGYWLVENGSNSIPLLPLDGIQINCAEGSINVSGMQEEVTATLYMTSGVTIGKAEGKDFHFKVPQNNIYILQMTDSKGRTAKLKLQSK